MANNYISNTNNLNESCGPNRIQEMIMGYQQTQIMYAACSLGVFDLLGGSYEGLSIDTISTRLETNPGATDRLLNACVGLGLLKKYYTTNGIVLFENTSATRQFLIGQGRINLRPMLDKVCDLYPLWGKLSQSVKEGNNQMSKTLGVPEEGFKQGSGFYGTPQKQREFLRVMHSFSLVDSPAVIQAVDFRKFYTICDLGGCTGALGIEIARSVPTSHVIVCDLNYVIQQARQFLPDNLPSNLSLQSLDFFEETLPQSDLYILSHIIHDWNDIKVDYLLNKISRSLQPGGRLLILEKLLNNEKSGPLDALYQDIGMLLVSEGKERCAEEYTELLRKHSFKTEIIPLTKAKFRDVILATKMEKMVNETAN